MGAGGWFPPGPPFPPPNKTNRHDVAEILLKVSLNTIKQYHKLYFTILYFVLSNILTFPAFKPFSIHIMIYFTVKWCTIYSFIVL
jgi:hypothetical protein